MPYSTTNPRIDRDNAAVGSTGNSVFQIKLGGLENDLEQNNDIDEKPKSNSKKINIGDYISGNEINTNNHIKGKVIEIDVENKVIYIMTKDKKKKKISGSSASKIEESLHFTTFSQYIEFA